MKEDRRTYIRSKLKHFIHYAIMVWLKNNSIDNSFDTAN